MGEYVEEGVPVMDRMRLLAVSAIRTAPEDESTATALGMESCAAVASLPSPLYPGTPVPATASMRPEVTLSILMRLTTAM